MKKTSGISLVSLIITVVVMLILAGIALTFSITDEGVIKKAETANLKGKIEEIREKVELEYDSEKIEAEKISDGIIDSKRMLERIVRLKEKEYNEEIDSVKLTTKTTIMYVLSEKLGGLSVELDLLTGKIGEYVDELEKVVGNSDLWVLDNKKTKITGYNGTGEQLKDVVVPNVVVVEGQECQISEISGLNNVDFEGTLTIASNLNIAQNSLRNCSKVKKIVIGDNISIGAYTGNHPLSNCSELEIIEMGRNIKMVLDYDNGYTAVHYSFINNNPKLSKVTVESLSQVGSKAFASIGSALQGTVVVNEGVKGIGIYAFNGCSNVERIVLPSSLEYVGENAFNNCTNCQINLPTKVTTIGAGAFYNCKKMIIDVVIRTGMTLESSAFSNSGIRSVKIEDGVTLPVKSFYNCDNLVTVQIGNDVTIPLTDSRYEPSFSYCNNLEQVNMGENIKIGDGPSYYLVFYENPKLETVTVKSLSQVGYGAFQRVGKALKGTITINNLEKIGDYAFNNCSSIEKISVKMTKEQWENVKKGTGWANGINIDVINNIEFIQ